MGTLRLMPVNATIEMQKPPRNDQNLAISLLDACFAHPTGLIASWPCRRLAAGCASLRRR